MNHIPFTVKFLPKRDIHDLFCLFEENRAHTFTIFALKKLNFSREVVKETQAYDQWRLTTTVAWL